MEDRLSRRRLFGLFAVAPLAAAIPAPVSVNVTAMAYLDAIAHPMPPIAPMLAEHWIEARRSQLLAK